MPSALWLQLLLTQAKVDLINHRHTALGVDKFMDALQLFWCNRRR
jgi:hypothetical protein